MVGIIPHFLERQELAHRDVSELVVVDSMHVRKRIMTERADAFCILPGGIGTLDEAFEAITWRQLGLHAKPIVFLDPDGYWEPLARLFGAMETRGYLRVAASELLVRVARPEEVLPALAKLGPAGAPEWLERS